MGVGDRANKKRLLCSDGLSNAMGMHCLPSVKSFFCRKADRVCFGLAGTKQSLNLSPCLKISLFNTVNATLSFGTAIMKYCPNLLDLTEFLFGCNTIYSIFIAGSQ